MNVPKLNALLKKHPHHAHGAMPDLVAQKDPVATMVYSFLLWEATTAQAIEAYGRLAEAMVDFNDLRVSLATEVIAMLGPRYPRGEERAKRLRASLNDLFKREHAVKFPQEKGGKRDIRAYVDSLEGMVPSFVGTRLLLLCFEAHGMPADEQTRSMLAEAGVCEPDVDLIELGNALARHVKAEHAEAAHVALQSHVDAWHLVNASHASHASKSGGGEKRAVARSKKR